MAKSNRQLKEGADFGTDPGIRGRFAPLFFCIYQAYSLIKIFKI